MPADAPQRWQAIAVDGTPWHSWHGTERGARRAAAAMARRIAATEVRR